MRKGVIQVGAWLVVFAAMGGFVVATGAQADEALRWKFKVGEKLEYDMVQQMSMEMSGAPFPKPLTTEMRQEMNMTWDVQGVDDKTGEAVIKQKFNRVKMKMNSPIGAFDYDSKSEEAPTGLGAIIAPMYKAMTEGEFEITMTSRGEVKDVKIPEGVLAALKNSPAAGQMGEFASSEGFKKMISQGALVLPKDPPKKGDTWSTKVEMKNPAVGMQTIETTYRYDGTKDVKGTTYALIKPTLKMEFGLTAGPPEKGMVWVNLESKKYHKEGSPWYGKTKSGKYLWEADAIKAGYEAAGQSEKDQPRQPVAQQNTQMTIKDQTSAGEILFNPAAGRLHSTLLKQNVTISANAGGQPIEQKIDQKIEVTVTPAGEKKTTEESKPKASDSK